MTAFTAVMAYTTLTGMTRVPATRCDVSNPLRANMMWIGGTGGSFDQTFLLLQGVSIAGALVALLASRTLGTWTIWVATAAVAVSGGAFASWYLVHPPQNGIDGAGRLLLGVPAVLINVLLAAVPFWRHWRR